MAVTRDQARRLLTQPEMALFGDSRNPALRALSAKELASRIERTRKLRDKSRDLLQRQKLKSRERTGSKRGTSGSANERTQKKSEVLDDILQRFESRLEDVQRAEEAGAKSKAGAKLPARKAAAKAPARRTAAKAPAKAPAKASAKSATAARKAPAGAAAREGSGKKQKPGKSAAAPGKSLTAPSAPRRGKERITSDEAMARTRELLGAKQQRTREPHPYRELEPQAGDQGKTGYQSGEAKSKALELHAGEIRLDPIHGSISTRDRHNQRKRDSR